MMIAARRYGAGQSKAATVGGNASAPINEANETIRVNANATPKTPATIPIGLGANANQTPSDVATPLPPLNFKKMEAIEPTKVANPTVANADGAALKTNRVNSIGMKPLRTSAIKVTAPGSLPPARATFVVPILPDPTALGSNPHARPTSTPTGIAPNR